MLMKYPLKENNMKGGLLHLRNTVDKGHETVDYSSLLTDST